MHGVHQIQVKRTVFHRAGRKIRRMCLGGMMRQIELVVVVVVSDYVLGASTFMLVLRIGRNAAFSSVLHGSASQQLVDGGAVRRRRGRGEQRVFH